MPNGATAGRRTAPPKVASAAKLTASEFADAFGNAVTQPSRLHRVHDVLELAPSFDPANLPRLLESLRHVPEEDASLVLRTFLAAAAANNPLGVAEEARRNQLASTRLGAIKAILDVWARTDEAAAFLWVGQLESKVRRQCLFDLAATEIEEHFGHGPETMRTALAIRTENVWDTGDVDNAFDRWAASDPAAALSEALSISDPELRSTTLDAVIRGTELTDARAALAWFQKLPKAEQDRHVEAFAGVVAEKDPQAAIDLVSSIKDDSRRYGAIGALAWDLCSDHREAAVALIAAVPPEASEHLASFLENWCREDPKAALPECARRMDALSPDDPIRKEFADFFKNNFAGINANEGDPLPIANFLVADANPERIPWIEEVTRAWAQRDFAAARQWMDAQNDPAVRAHAVAGVAEGWAWHGAADAAKWIETLPAGSLHDAAIGGFARSAFFTDPDTAVAWIRTIADPGQQMSQLQTSWQSWHDIQEDEAERWRDSAADLSDAERAALRVVKKDK